MINELIGKNSIESFSAVINEKNKDLNAVLRNEYVEGNKEGKYYGIPFLVKDNMQVIGTKTTCGSKILENYNSVFTATAVQNLLNTGFSVIGKTNLDEFAMGGANENSAFGPVRNPHALERVAGGSSGGSAAGVAANMAPFALGSDTGGSVREPAAFCGVVGYKPSYGLISRYGLVAFASSLDQIGVISHSVEDAAIVAENMKSPDPMDSTTVNHETDLTSMLGKVSLNGLKIAVPDLVYSDGIDKKIVEKFNESVELLRKHGAVVETISLPELKHSVSIYYIIAPSEASSNLARFDGVRYGSRKNAEGLEEMYYTTREEGFGTEVKRRILIGTFTLSSAYYDAYFSKASKIRRIIKEKLEKLYETYDVVLTPTAPAVPPKVGEKLSPLSYYLLDLFTIPANLAGLPAISIPFGTIEGLPFGVHFMGKRLKDAEMLGAAHEFEKIIKDSEVK